MVVWCIATLMVPSSMPTAACGIRLPKRLTYRPPSTRSPTKQLPVKQPTPHLAGGWMCWKRTLRLPLQLQREIQQRFHQQIPTRTLQLQACRQMSTKMSRTAMLQMLLSPVALMFWRRTQLLPLQLRLSKLMWIRTSLTVTLLTLLCLPDSTSSKPIPPQPQLLLLCRATLTRTRSIRTQQSPEKQPPAPTPTLLSVDDLTCWKLTQPQPPLLQPSNPM